MRALEIALLMSACCVLRAPSVLAAEPRPQRNVGVRLEVERGANTEQCIDAGALERGVEARLHRSAFTHAADAPLVIRLRLERRAHRDWAADLRLDTDSGVSLGQRELSTSANHCSSLDDSIALVVALLVDAPLTEREQAARAGSVSTPAAASPPEAKPDRPVPKASLDAPAAASEPTPLRLPPSTLAPREPWRWESGLSGSLALGELPGAAWGVELGVSGLPTRGPGLRLFAAAYVPRDAHAGPGEAGARFGLLLAGVELCPLQGSLGGVRWSACAGQTVGRLSASAFGYDQNSSVGRLTYAVLAHSVLTVPLVGGVSARVSARAELPLTRPVFYYGSRENAERNVFEMSRVVGVFDVGLSIAL